MKLRILATKEESEYFGKMDERYGHERSGTAVDPGAHKHELQGRDSEPPKKKVKPAVSENLTEKRQKDLEEEKHGR